MMLMSLFLYFRNRVSSSCTSHHFAYYYLTAIQY
jgi:hypothetical protein